MPPSSPCFDHAERPSGAGWRFDQAPLGEGTRTEEGYLRIPATLAAKGILPYRFAGGKVVRELVPESTLMDAEFLTSLENKPVTLEHPTDARGQLVLLTPENIHRYRVGTVLAPVRYEGGFVNAILQIENKAAIEAIERQGIREVSPCYHREFVEQPGFDSEDGAYDMIQTKRFAGNHVALTEKGRGGPKIRLQITGDSAVLDVADPPGEVMKLSAAVIALLTLLSMDPALFADDATALAAAQEKVKTLLSTQATTAATVESMETVPEAVELVAAAGPEMPPADPALGPKMDSAVQARRKESHRKTWTVLNRVSKELVEAQAFAKKHGIAADSLGLDAIKKQLVIKLSPGVRADADRSYYDARYDLLKGQGAGPKADSLLGPSTETGGALGRGLTQPGGTVKPPRSSVRRTLDQYSSSQKED